VVTVVITVVASSAPSIIMVACTVVVAAVVVVAVAVVADTPNPSTSLDGFRALRSGSSRFWTAAATAPAPSPWS
jgi:hypothetical protein